MVDDPREGENAVCRGDEGSMPRWERVRIYKCRRCVRLSLSQPVAFSSRPLSSAEGRWAQSTTMIRKPEGGPT